MPGIDIYNSLTSQLQSISSRRNDRYQDLISGGSVAPWHKKSSAQIQTYVQSNSTVSKNEAFDLYTTSAEGALRTQLAGLDELIKTAQQIKVNYLSGNFAAAESATVLKKDVEMIRNNIYSALTMQYDGNGYVFGGTARFSIPIEDIRDEAMYPGIGTGSASVVAGDFSKAIQGNYDVYLNNNQDTLKLSMVSSSSEGVVRLVNSVLLLANSTSGKDEQALEASKEADAAHDLLIHDRDLVLKQINIAMAKKSEREIQTQMFVENNEQVNIVPPEEALSDIQRINMLETAAQEILVQQKKLSEKAAKLMERANG